MMSSDKDCHDCGHTMTQLGCTVENRPFHWCPTCGAIRTCDGVEASPASKSRIVAVGILLAAGLHDAFERALERRIHVSESAHWITHTPIEKSFEAKGKELWENLVSRDELPPYHPEQEEPL
jgi:hypothetical protein